jgi:hypothetical protein
MCFHLIKLAPSIAALLRAALATPRLQVTRLLSAALVKLRNLEIKHDIALTTTQITPHPDDPLLLSGARVLSQASCIATALRALSWLSKDAGICPNRTSGPLEQRTGPWQQARDVVIVS